MMSAFIVARSARRKSRKYHIGRQCYYCERNLTRSTGPSDPTRATIDHKIPKARGGTNHQSNRVWACYECNQDKADLTAEEYIWFFKRVEGASLYHKKIMRAFVRGLFNKDAVE